MEQAKLRNLLLLVIYLPSVYSQNTYVVGIELAMKLSIPNAPPPPALHLAISFLYINVDSAKYNLRRHKRACSQTYRIGYHESWNALIKLSLHPLAPALDVYEMSFGRQQYDSDHQLTGYYDDVGVFISVIQTKTGVYFNFESSFRLLCLKEGDGKYSLLQLKTPRGKIRIPVIVKLAIRKFPAVCDKRCKEETKASVLSGYTFDCEGPYKSTTGPPVHIIIDDECSGEENGVAKLVKGKLLIPNLKILTFSDTDRLINNKQTTRSFKTIIFHFSRHLTQKTKGIVKQTAGIYKSTVVACVARMKQINPSGDGVSVSARPTATKMGSCFNKLDDPQLT
ncbi:hypothetical protein RF11_14574 [Thelohanellus kitauei]|uniref:Uncharacterized protein n=1 Tax=Thelohanellus kitauei TaxID=669202 RepID=A0A0C2JHA3_THEKT|nr:hypothetical protein RF11_14574 [Thelohanellus kitauei]